MHLVPTRVFVATFQRTFYAWRKGYSMAFYARCGLIHSVFSTLDGQEVQSIRPGTVAAYETFIKNKSKTVEQADLRAKIARHIEPLPADIGGSMLWLGNPATASKVVLQFHGGGFFIPGSAGHLQWAWQCYIQTGHDAGVDVAVCMLEYTLLPAGPFPTPLKQAAAALNKILDAGVKPSDIFIGGDSAGGNITVQLLGHLLHPHPEVQPVKLSEPLGGAFLVSPGVTKTSTAKSFIENGGIDMVPSNILPIVEKYMEDAAIAQGRDRSAEARHQTGLYVSPLSGPDTWFDGLETVVSNVYVTVGDKEILRDPAVEFSQLLKSKSSGDMVTLEIADDEAHVFIVLENLAGINGSATKRMSSWFLKAISKSKA